MLKTDVLHLRRRLATVLAAALGAAILLVGVSGCDDLLGAGGDGGDDGDTGGISLDTPLPAATTATDSAGNTYSVGYDQVSGDDQDPYVLKKDASGTQLWRLRHDETPIDGRAILLALDGQDRPYVVFTADGGSNDDDRYQRNHVETGAFDDAPFPSYSSGGGAKVAVIARLDPDTGAIDRGTFLVARLSSGNTNTLNATGLTISGDSVLLDVESAAWPPAAGATASTWVRFDETLFNDATRPPLRYTLDGDLTEITTVQVLPE